MTETGRKLLEAAHKLYVQAEAGTALEEFANWFEEWLTEKEGPMGPASPTRPIVVYDIFIDAYRPATQADVDSMAAVVQAYTSLRTNINKELLVNLQMAQRAKPAG